MDVRIFKEMIAVVRGQRRRLEQPPVGEDAGTERDRWMWLGEPLVNDLCLLVLVALNHEVEREWISLAARSLDDGRDISAKQYEQHVREVRCGVRRPGGWKKLADRAGLRTPADHPSMKALRLLANCYKHDPWKGPDDELLRPLKLDLKANYAPLNESDALREGLASLIGLGPGADYDEVAERFVDAANGFISDIQKDAKLSPVRREPVSLKPSDFAR